MQDHYAEFHAGEAVPSAYMRKKAAIEGGFFHAQPLPKSDTPALDALLAADAAYKAAVADIEAERDRLSKKLLALDDALADARKRL